MFDNYDVFGNEYQENMENDIEYVKVPYGVYDVSISSIELKETTKEPKRPMVTITYKVNSGDYKGCYIFQNQLIDTAQKTVIFNKTTLKKIIPESMLSTVDFIVKDFDGYKQLLNNIFGISADYDYQLNFDANSKNADFDSYEIEKIFQKQIDPEDLPFE